MEALSDGIRDCRRHVIGLEQDLMIVEAQDGEAAQGESSISPKIPMDAFWWRNWKKGHS